MASQGQGWSKLRLIQLGLCTSLIPELQAPHAVLCRVPNTALWALEAPMALSIPENSNEAQLQTAAPTWRLAKPDGTLPMGSQEGAPRVPGLQ